jgi:hypothetical protein
MFAGGVKDPAGTVSAEMTFASGISIRVRPLQASASDGAS